MENKLLLFLGVFLLNIIETRTDSFDVLIDKKAADQHRLDSLNLLIYTILLTLTVSFYLNLNLIMGFPLALSDSERISGKIQIPEVL